MTKSTTLQAQASEMQLLCRVAGLTSGDSVRNWSEKNLKSNAAPYGQSESADAAQTAVH